MIGDGDRDTPIRLAHAEFDGLTGFCHVDDAVQNFFEHDNDRVSWWLEEDIARPAHVDRQTF